MRVLAGDIAAVRQLLRTSVAISRVMDGSERENQELPALHRSRFADRDRRLPPPGAPARRRPPSGCDAARNAPTPCTGSSVPSNDPVELFAILHRLCLGALDLIQAVGGTLGYSELLRRSEEFDIEGTSVRALDLETLIETKRYANRPKDLLAVLELQRILEGFGIPARPIYKSFYKNVARGT